MNSKVVVKEVPPFVIKDEEWFSGFSIDLWEKLAQEAEIPFEYMEIETINDQLAEVGIALPLESTYRKEINKALLDVTASGAYNEMNDKWFGG